MHSFFVAERRVSWKRNGKVQPNLMVRFTVVFKEVFSDAEQLIALNLNTKLLEELSDDSVFTLLPRLYSTARKRPESFSFEPMQQYVPVLKHDSASTEMKAVGIDTEGDHGA